MQQQPDPYNYTPQASSYPPPPPQGYEQPNSSYGPPPYSQPYNQPYGQAYSPPQYIPPTPMLADPLIRQRRRIAFGRGLVFGLVMGVIVALWVAYAILPQIPAFLPSGSTVSLLQALPVWVVYFFAGRSGARAGRSVGTGVITCLWATLWYLLIDFAGFIVIGVYYHSVPTFGGLGLDTTLALLGVGIGAFGASRIVLARRS